MGGDGQVSLGDTVLKGNARKIRRLADGSVLAGFAGGTADAFTLFELFEGKLQQYGNLTRAAVELAKDWRTDRRLRRLEAMLCVADRQKTLLVSGSGDVVEPEDGLLAARAPAEATRAPQRARPAGGNRAGRRGSGPPLAGDRGGHLRLHQLGNRPSTRS